MAAVSGMIYFYCDAGDTIAPVTGKGRDGVFIDNKSSFLRAVNLFFLFAVICRTAAVLFFDCDGKIIFLTFADNDEAAVRIRMGGDGRFRIFDLYAVYADSAVDDIFSCLAF